jgi:hypothetical protein
LKHASELGLQGAYHHYDTGVQYFINCLFALALIEPKYVNDAYVGLLEDKVALLTTSIYVGKLNNLIRYFESSCLVKKLDENGNEKWYPGLWTVSTLNIRTNNSIEGWHHYWNSTVMKGGKHANLWNFIVYK